jgi:hypothetical protein
VHERGARLRPGLQHEPAESRLGVLTYSTEVDRFEVVRAIDVGSYLGGAAGALLGATFIVRRRCYATAMKRVAPWLVLPLLCVAVEAVAVVAFWPQLAPRVTQYRVLDDWRR